MIYISAMLGKPTASPSNGHPTWQVSRKGRAECAGRETLQGESDGGNVTEIIDATPASLSLQKLTAAASNRVLV